MKILIANPAFRIDLGGGLERYKLGSGMRYPWSLLKRRDECPRYAMFPLFLAYAAALAEKNGFTVNVIDSVPLNIGNEEFLTKVESLNPDIILFEPNAAIVEELMTLLVQLRSKVNAKFIVAGSHVTSSFTELFERFPIINYALVGEYELAFLELLCVLRDNRQCESVKGLVYRDPGGVIKENGRTAPIEDLDELPMPARHLFPAYFNTDMSVYLDGFCQFNPAYHMHTSRGCAFSCNFCDRVQVLFAGSSQRFFSPQRVVDEMMTVVKAGAREIYIDDDNFTSSKKHVSAICDEIIKRKLFIPWSAMCDAMSLDTLLLRKMSQAGCVGIKFGLDSADINVLNAIKKPLKLKNLEDVVECAKSLKIKTHMSVVFGLTGETKDSLHMTFCYACTTDIDSIQFSLATPLPGTPMYKDLLKNGSLTSTKWSDLDGANRTVITYPDISKEYLENFMANSNRDWLRRKFKNPGWILRQIRYSARLARSQGFSGIKKRVIRAFTLLKGDAKVVIENNSKKIIRF